jgi:hypothetical protein
MVEMTKGVPKDAEKIGQTEKTTGEKLKELKDQEILTEEERRNVKSLLIN